MKKLMISVVAVVAMSSAVYAGGKLVEPPHVPPVEVVTDDWSGPYIGLQAGYITGKAYVNITHSTNLTVARIPDVKYDTLEMKPDGFIGGVFAGYNKKFDNNFLLGIEGAFNYTNIKDTKVLKKLQDPIGRFTLKQQNEAALYLRAGYVTNNNLMPYILGGVTWTKLKGGLNIGNNTLWDSDSVTGWTAGAGLEYKINKKWHVRAQYRYSRYKEAKFSWKDGADTYKGSTSKYRTHSIMVGVSYHFK